MKRVARWGAANVRIGRHTVASVEALGTDPDAIARSLYVTIRLGGYIRSRELEVTTALADDGQSCLVHVFTGHRLAGCFDLHYRGMAPVPGADDVEAEG